MKAEAAVVSPEEKKKKNKNSRTPETAARGSPEFNPPLPLSHAHKDPHPKCCKPFLWANVRGKVPKDRYAVIFQAVHQMKA